MLINNVSSQGGQFPSILLLSALDVENIINEGYGDDLKHVYNFFDNKLDTYNITYNESTIGSTQALRYVFDMLMLTGAPTSIKAPIQNIGRFLRKEPSTLSEPHHRTENCFMGNHMIRMPSDFIEIRSDLLRTLKCVMSDITSNSENQYSEYEAIKPKNVDWLLRSNITEEFVRGIKVLLPYIESSAKILEGVTNFSVSSGISLFENVEAKQQIKISTTCNLSTTIFSNESSHDQERIIELLKLVNDSFLDDDESKGMPKLEIERSKIYELVCMCDHSKSLGISEISSANAHILLPIIDLEKNLQYSNIKPIVIFSCVDDGIVEESEILDEEDENEETYFDYYGDYDEEEGNVNEERDQSQETDTLSSLRIHFMKDNWESDKKYLRSTQPSEKVSISVLQDDIKHENLDEDDENEDTHTGGGRDYYSEYDEEERKVEEERETETDTRSSLRINFTMEYLKTNGTHLGSKYRANRPSEKISVSDLLDEIKHLPLDLENIVMAGCVQNLVRLYEYFKVRSFDEVINLQSTETDKGYFMRNMIDLILRKNYISEDIKRDAKCVSPFVLTEVGVENRMQFTKTLRGMDLGLYQAVSNWPINISQIISNGHEDSLFRVLQHLRLYYQDLLISVQKSESVKNKAFLEIMETVLNSDATESNLKDDFKIVMQYKTIDMKASDQFDIGISPNDKILNLRLKSKLFPLNVEQLLADGLYDSLDCVIHLCENYSCFSILEPIKDVVDKVDTFIHLLRVIQSFSDTDENFRQHIDAILPYVIYASSSYGIW